MRELSWTDRIKAKRRAKTFRAVTYVAGAFALWLTLVGAGVWAWVHVFHQAPPNKLVFDWFTAIGGGLIAPIAARAPLAPMKGKDPEVLAADEFFKGPRR